MIGDHHGRTAGGITLLVRAVDAILGTHTPLAYNYRHALELSLKQAIR